MQYMFHHKTIQNSLGLKSLLPQIGRCGAGLTRNRAVAEKLPLTSDFQEASR